MNPTRKLSASFTQARRSLVCAISLLAVLFGLAESRVVALQITEILTENDGGLRDADGDSPDWLELYNDSASPLNLAGWHLTDQPTNLVKWTFPATNLPSGMFLIVFASGKDRAVAGAELHTSFKLDSGGGYLALVEPDGTTVAQSISYPAQRANISSGPPSTNAPTVTLLLVGASARWLVPVDGALSASWTAPAFNAATWSNTATPLGFNAGPAPGPPLLRVDFSDDEQTSPARELGAADTEAGFSVMTLGANPTNFVGIGLQLSPMNGGVLDDRDRTLPTQGGLLTLDQIYDDFIFVVGTTNGNGARLQISGLTPNASYQLTFWSFDSSSAGQRLSDWIVTAGGVTNVITNGYSFDGGVLPARDTDNTFGGPVTASPAGGVTVEGRRSGGTSHGVFLNGFQIAPFSSFAVSGSVPSMYGSNASLYVRIPFTVGSTSGLTALTLRVRYNDGFVAYLNGTEVARRNAPAGQTWNSVATAPHLAADSEDIVVPQALGLLATGTNLLALHALNTDATNGDFFIEPELIGTLALPTTTGFYSPPTPGAANGTAFLGLVGDTKFSVNRGFYDAPFSLSITCATPGATIYFTTNGTAPSPSNGLVFSSPINITGNSFIRAAAHVAGWVPTDIDTHSYIFLRDVLRQSNNIPGYPTTWQGSYPADYAMDSNVVNHGFYGQTISNDLRSIPVLSIVTEFDGLWGPVRGIYNHATDTHDLDLGRDWERAASAELILPEGTNGKTAFAVNCAVRMQGNASRDNARTPKHSFRLLFKSEYGPTKLRYDWFPGEVAEFDNIVLRAAGFVDGWPSRYSDTNVITGGGGLIGLRYRPQTATYLRDVWAKASHRDMGWLASRSDWVHLYINGLYWGLYNPSERFDAGFAAGHLGGEEADWDVLVGADTAPNNAEPTDGNTNDWNTVLTLVNAGITNEAAYQAVGQLVDLDSLIDYMLLHIYIESEDWPHHNYYAAHRRANPTNGLPATKWIFLTWDQELSLDRLVRRDLSEVGNQATPTSHLQSPARLHFRLRNWPEYRRQFGDRIHKHLFNDGALTPSNNVARFAALANVITNAINGESARWGDAREFTIGSNPGTGQTFTRDEWWVPELQKLWTNFFQTLNATNIARFRTDSLYPLIGAPGFNQFGGLVPAAFGLSMAHTNVSGVIYYTTDGTDPREYGSGAVAGTAQSYATPVIINTPTLVRARVFSGGGWSALVESVFYPPQDLSRLALTELMFHPPNVGLTNSDEFEFLELKNTGTNALNLSGLTFSGINFTFTNGTLLGSGQFFVLARNALAFASKYPGVTINGIYTGRLDNGGEVIALLHPFGAKIFGVTYDDTAPWPVTADGHGFSLVQRNPGLSQAPDSGAAWRASANIGGSPGTDDPSSIIPSIVINEVLTASFPPDVDRIELFNPTMSAVNIGGWFLTDDHGVPKKFRITDGTMIPALGFAVFDETQFNPTPGTNNSFSLSSRGDEVYLFSGDAATNLTGYSHGFGFGGAAPGITFGRYVNSVGEEQLPALIYATFSNANAGPLIGPVVLNEIHYHPAPGGDEFVELKSINGNSLPLFDSLRPTNTWRIAGLNFIFPTNVTLPPYGLLLVVATNPAAFRAKYNVPTNVTVLGPFAGSLQDSGERLELRRPDVPDTNGVGYINVDVVRYNDRAPWPPAADGAGPSLQRLNAAAYGDDPINWMAAAPTPGAEVETADTDGDGVPDLWELAHGTQPLLADGNDDPDGDGVSNLDEFKAGTDPQSASSYLHVEQVSWEGGGLGLQFTARAQRSYSVLYKAVLDAPSWSKLMDVPEGVERVVTVSDPGPAATQRFYRLITPAAP